MAGVSTALAATVIPSVTGALAVEDPADRPLTPGSGSPVS